MNKTKKKQTIKFPDMQDIHQYLKLLDNTPFGGYYFLLIKWFTIRHTAYVFEEEKNETIKKKG